MTQSFWTHYLAHTQNWKKIDEDFALHRRFRDNFGTVA